jgi:hypothetical protein
LTTASRKITRYAEVAQHKDKGFKASVMKGCQSNSDDGRIRQAINLEEEPGKD